MDNRTPSPKLRLSLSRIKRDDRGATAVEYGLIIALIAVVIIVAVATLGRNLSNVFASVANTVTAAAPGGGGGGGGGSAVPTINGGGAAKSNCQGNQNCDITLTWGAANNATQYEWQYIDFGGNSATCNSNLFVGQNSNGENNGTTSQLTANLQNTYDTGDNICWRVRVSQPQPAGQWTYSTTVQI